VDGRPDAFARELAEVLFERTLHVGERGGVAREGVLREVADEVANVERRTRRQKRSKSTMWSLSPSTITWSAQKSRWIGRRVDEDKRAPSLSQARSRRS